MKTKQEHRTCVECGMKIPMERLRTLPDTWTCVRHSGVIPITENDLELDGTDNADMVNSAQGAVWR